MTPFEQMWEASRQNIWSGYTALALNYGIAATLFVALIPFRWIRRLCYGLVIVSTAWIATEFASLEIEEKWRIRYAYADEHRKTLTEDEQFAVTVDGANRVMGPLIFGAFPAFTRCGLALLGIVGFKYSYNRFRESRKANGNSAASI